jgi:PAS domain S-box-containing protein
MLRLALTADLRDWERLVVDDGDKTREQLLEEVVALRSQLKEMENTRILFQTILDNAPVLISAKDVKGTVILTNRQFRVLDGPSPEEFVGKNVYDLFPREVADQLWQNDLAAQATDEPIEAEETVAHKDGTTHTYYTLKFPLRDQAETLLGTCAVSTDITQVKELQQRLAVEKELARIKEYLDTILFNLPVGVAIYEGDDCQLFRINQVLAEQYGISVDDALGKPLAEVLPQASDHMLADLARVRATGEPILRRESVATHHQPPGQELQLVDWLIPIANDSGGSDAIVAVVLDVSDLHEAQTTLRRAQKMDALGTLAGGVAHDFNNILSVIVGNAELLLHHMPADDLGADYAKDISDAADRGADLVRQILTFSRMDAVALQALDPVSVVEEALRMLRSTSPATVEIVKEFPESCPEVIGDPTQLHQIVLNLFTNAHHAFHHRDGHGTITVKISPDSDFVSISVTDNGTGIAADDLERIFDPFFTTKEVGKGTGLGLSVVHGIIEKYGGTVDVVSELGAGTTVTVRLPVSVDPGVDAPAPEPSELQRGNGHILVVEDEPDLIALYKRVMERQGYTVTTCESGDEGYVEFLDNPDLYCLVFTDQEMPNMTGKQLSQRLLAIRPDLPIVLTTGFSATVTEEEALAMGIRKFLHKPLHVNDICSALDDCLNPKSNTE